MTISQLLQPNNASIVRAQYGNDDISLPAVGATFETTLPQSLKQKAQNNLVTKETENSFNINMYLDENIKDKEKVKSNAINFSACKLKDNQSTCELAKHVDEPTAKRRKINILPSGVDSYFSAPSTSSSTVPESNANNTESNVNNTQDIKEANKDDKKALGKQYLKDVST